MGRGALPAGPKHLKLLTPVTPRKASCPSCARGQYPQAEPLNQRSLAIREKALGPDHPDVATSLNNLALLYVNQGQYVQAEPLYKRSLAIREKTLGPDHPDVAMSLDNIAQLYKKSGRTKEVDALEKRAAAIRAIKYGSAPHIDPVHAP